MTLKILNNNEKQEIVAKLRKQFGIQEVPGLILRRGTERLFLFQGGLKEGGILDLEKTIPIERAGVYLGKDILGNIRLSIEGVHLLQDQINKNIFEMDSDQAEQWIKGQELNIQTGKRDFLVMKYKDDFIGTGKASENKIGNYIPKIRRLKSKEF